MSALVWLYAQNGLASGICSVIRQSRGGFSYAEAVEMNTYWETLPPKIARSRSI